jgi:hypothetical protein
MKALHTCPSRVEKQRGEVAQTMYTHVSECKNDKRKGEKKKKRVEKQKY